MPLQVQTKDLSSKQNVLAELLGLKFNLHLIESLRNGIVSVGPASTDGRMNQKTTWEMAQEQTQPGPGILALLLPNHVLILCWSGPEN